MDLILIITREKSGQIRTHFIKRYKRKKQKSKTKQRRNEKIKKCKRGRGRKPRKEKAKKESKKVSRGFGGQRDVGNEEGRTAYQ